MEKQKSICEDILRPYIIPLQTINLTSEFEDWTAALGSNDTEIIVQIDTSSAIICPINEVRAWQYFKKKPSHFAITQKITTPQIYRGEKTEELNRPINPIIHLESDISQLLSKVLMEKIGQDLIVMKNHNPQGKILLEDLNKSLCDIIYYQQREIEKLTNKKRQSEELMEIIGHDIRSPLGIILISCEYIKSIKDDPKSLEEDLIDSVERIHRNSKKGLELLNSILTLSKAKANEKIVTTQVDPKAFLDGVIDELRIFAHEKRILINVEHMIESNVNIEKNRISEIIENIVGNAIKFTPNNKSILITSTEYLDGNHRSWRIAIKDDGPGIPASQMKNIFEKFTQLDTGTVKKLGFGLGLAISQQFAELHGGQIFVDSQLGKGTTFIIEIPDCFVEQREFIPPSIENLADEKKAGNTKKLILIAESDIVAREFASNILSKAGFEVIQAYDGMEAFLIIKKKSPDLIISDSNLLEISGVELLELTRLSGMNTPFILTANRPIISRDNQKLIDSLASQNITKPYTPDLLLKAVFNQLDGPQK